MYDIDLNIPYRIIQHSSRYEIVIWHIPKL